MRAFVKLVIMMMLMVIGTETVAPLFSESRAYANEQSERGRATDFVSAVTDADCDHNADLNCDDACGLPAHLHMSQFPPVAFHESIDNAPFEAQFIEMSNAAVMAHTIGLNRPPIRS